jgi:hypothetical protein
MKLFCVICKVGPLLCASREVFVTLHVVYVSKDHIEWDLSALDSTDSVFQVCEASEPVATELNRIRKG